VILISALIIGNPTIELDEIDSTNDYASRLLAEDASISDGTVICAQHQTKGRGQFDAKWFTNKAENLTMSIILKPSQLHIKKQFYLTIISSLSTVSLLKNYGISASVKWPNDIYVKKNKIAGILIQNSISGYNIQASIIGIGLNVNQQAFHPSVPNPSSISLETGKAVDLFNLRLQFFEYFESYYTDLINGHFEALLSEYLDSLYQRNKVATYQKDDGTIFSGIIKSVDESGVLYIEVEDSTIQSFTLKEIRFL
jgi:BirA family biotin operon repressor/biotin-[acetyl-CoA-carboxylase] ligase